MVQAALTGKASSSLRAGWNSGSRTSANGLKPAPTELHRCGGSKYPKGRARRGRGRWAYPPSPTARLRRGGRALSRRSFKRAFPPPPTGNQPAASPLTALDLWFERKFQRQCRGEAYLVRFVDDFVVSFQHLADAETFQGQLRERFAKFNLELAEEKTRLLLFGRFAAERCARNGRRPETFEFLGFKHVCGADHGGRFAVIRLPSVKRCPKFLARAHEWLVQHMHWRRPDQQRHLGTMLEGFYQYFRLHHCQKKLDWIRHEVQLQWRRTLRQQSQRHRLHWSYLATREWFKLPLPPRRTLHPTV